jgi:hypothetical protein
VKSWDGFINDGRHTYHMEKIDLVTGIIELESGQMSEERAIGFARQHKETLVNLQGCYGRWIAQLEEAGLI